MHVFINIDWNIHYRALCHYGEKHGHCKVPRTTVYSCDIPESDEPKGEIIQYRGKLGRWLDDQRKAKKGRRTHLSPEKEELLQELVNQGNHKYF